MITSKKILDELGLKNIKTLTRWYKEYKLVPPPTIKTHPSGRGRIAYWNESDLPLFKFVKSKFDEGLKADEIKASIGIRDVETINAVFNHTDSIKQFIDNLIKASKAEPRKLFYNIYEDVLRALSSSQIVVNKRREIYNFLIDRDSLFKVFWYMEHGYNPVLFVMGEKKYILVDFIVSDLLSENDIQDICLIFPLKNSFTKFIKKITHGKIDFKIDKYPIHSVGIRKDGGRILNVPYIRTSLEFGSFELLRELTEVAWEGDEDKTKNEKI